MKKYPLLYIAFVLVILLAVVHFVADALYLYWALWWFDNLSHFLAGFSLGFFSLHIFYESGLFGNKLSLSKAVFISFIFVMILGGVWEIFEYINGLTQSTEKYSLDVIHDLLSDALGAILALLLSPLLAGSRHRR
ncbi:MAG: hypothetical protein UW76_C0016G0021 [Parcubacteria group bacterium GW2011_GWF2_44_8b]|nr:MAG: hypothetical protein UV94_C0010G0019 [Parcubacteria group bacterium GW2011_GWC1_43_30]KKT80159.1 MAG: hypothetical protein UW76_C0016G0021 [Parcubacteria group bacterium GW2011_GWF2_44_8b]KKT85173.1 MAG: hypothetical protein UW83_C0027G0008 [Parcubacteria group bacterium GW2011_GWD1_44_9]